MQQAEMSGKVPEDEAAKKKYISEMQGKVLELERALEDARTAQ